MAHHERFRIAAAQSYPSPISSPFENPGASSAVQTYLTSRLRSYPIAGANALFPGLRSFNTASTASRNRSHSTTKRSNDSRPLSVR